VYRVEVMMINRDNTILIIDPDAIARKEYASCLKKEGYEVDTCYCIVTAIEKMKNIPYDCIIMDVNLPVMKGYEAVKILKTVNPQTQIIITAARNTLELEANVRSQDIFYYYIKSFDKQELVLAVRNVFEKLGKIKEANDMNGPARILIVDDDPDYVEATRLILENKGYQIEAAFNREEALEKVNRIKPDLILLDIMMDRLDDGFTICYKLKHDPKLKHIPVFTISSITDKTGFKFNPKTDGEYFEADDYAIKPIEADDLVKRIKKLLKA
jgi:CheY-like chemotaxis protein